MVVHFTYEDTALHLGLSACMSVVEKCNSRWEGRSASFRLVPLSPATRPNDSFVQNDLTYTETELCGLGLSVSTPKLTFFHYRFCLFKGAFKITYILEFSKLVTKYVNIICSVFLQSQKENIFPKWDFTDKLH